ncbi:GroES-like protein [Rhizodiscina lignyota]|uniref:GroES-like protein n=1 Tax=Rhizodiscina lignyota TaxID=1504668 RepID=A0A9P4M4A1_9PEZI|nr:GroES-like protein [Rhizodiscina lignyota]
MSDYKFEGWCGLDSNAASGNMQWQEYQPKPWTEDDVDIRITHCGMCASDLIFLRTPWAPDPYPCVVGHEIVGKAIRVGQNIKHIKEGDRVGVGPQASACLEPDCFACADGVENYCPRPEHVGTFGGRLPDGSRSYGGYAKYNRTPGHFVFEIPDKLNSHHAAPALCAGVTVYSALKHESVAGKKVGVVGLGGLGHFAVLFAKAMGAAHVVVISRSSSKKDDATQLGADDFLATSEEKAWHTPAGRLADRLDLIISTVASPGMPLAGYLSLLAFEGTIVQLGASVEPLPGFPPFLLMRKRNKIVGSAIGAPEEIRETLELMAEHNIRPWVEKHSMRDANEALKDLAHGSARYRYCLVDEKPTE